MIFQELENCIECGYNHSPHKFYVSTELAEYLGGVDGIEKTFTDHGNVNNMMPRRSSARRPWTLIDWELMQRNTKLNKRHWVYNPSCIIGSTRYYGYGHQTDQGFQFYDWNPERKCGSPVAGRRDY